MYNPMPDNDKWNYVVSRTLNGVTQFYCGGEGSNMTHEDNWTDDPDLAWVVHQIKTTAIAEIYNGSTYSFYSFTVPEFIEYRKQLDKAETVL